MVVIATTNQIDGVEPTLRRPGKFDYEIEIPVPTAVDRKQVCCKHCSSITFTLIKLNKFVVVVITDT